MGATVAAAALVVVVCENNTNAHPMIIIGSSLILVSPPPDDGEFSVAEMSGETLSHQKAKMFHASYASQRNVGTDAAAVNTEIFSFSLPPPENSGCR